MQSDISGQGIVFMVKMSLFGVSGGEYGHLTLVAENKDGGEKRQRKKVAKFRKLFVFVISFTKSYGYNALRSVLKERFEYNKRKVVLY